MRWECYMVLVESAFTKTKHQYYSFLFFFYYLLNTADH